MHGGEAVRRAAGVLLEVVGTEFPHAVNVEVQIGEGVADRVLRRGACLIEKTADLGAAQLAAVARFRAVEQVVRLVKEENIARVGRARFEIAAEIRRLVNEVVAVADDEVARLREVERQLIGADAVLARDVGNRVGIVDARRADKVSDGVRHAPEMPLGTGADLGRALHWVAQLHRADALLCRDVDGADAGFVRHLPCRVQRGKRCRVL